VEDAEDRESDGQPARDHAWRCFAQIVGHLRERADQPQPEPAGPSSSCLHTGNSIPDSALAGGETNWFNQGPVQLVKARP
jgi:hypothetical protein